MEAKVTAVQASVKLTYAIEEDLLYMHGRGDSGDIFLSEWALGTRKDVLESALKVLTMAKDDETIIIGIVPNGRPSPEKPSEAALSVVEPSPVVWDHQGEQAT